MEEQLKELLFNATVGKIAAIIIGIAVIWTIIKTIQRNLFSRIKDNDNRYKANKFGIFAGYLLTIILLTVVFSDKLQGLTVALGVAGAGIAFSMQEIIVSFAGWLAIIFGGFYKSGDRVQLGGIKGDVMDIGVLRTTIMETGQWVDGDLYNGRIVLVANSFVFKEAVFNYSGQFPFLWDEIKIPIKYGSNYQMAREILLQVGNDVAGDLTTESRQDWTLLQAHYRLEDACTEPMVSLIATDAYVELTLRYIVEYKKRRTTKSELYTQILQKIEATNGVVGFSSANSFELVNSSNIEIINKETNG